MVAARHDPVSGAGQPDGDVRDGWQAMPAVAQAVEAVDAGPREPGRDHRLIVAKHVIKTRGVVVSTSCDRPDPARQNMTSGGVSDREHSVPTVTPRAIPLLSKVVTTDTGVATRASMSRNVVTSTSRRPATFSRSEVSGGTVARGTAQVPAGLVHSGLIARRRFTARHP